MREQARVRREADKALDEANKAAYAEYSQTIAAAKKEFQKRTRRANTKLEKAYQEYRDNTKEIESKYHRAVRHADKLVDFADDLPASDPTRKEALEQARRQCEAIKRDAGARKEKALAPFLAALKPIEDECVPLLAAEQAKFDAVERPACEKMVRLQDEAREKRLAAYNAGQE